MNREELIETLKSAYDTFNENYIKKYIDFCIKYDRRGNSIAGYHNHHILPKGITKFKKYENLGENKWNSSILSPRAHYIAHRILAKAIPKSSCAINSYGLMAHSIKRKSFITSKEYEEYSFLKSELQMNGRFINKDGMIKFIQNDELNEYLSKGWVLGYGRSYKNIEKDGVSKRIDVSKENLDEYLLNGWEIVNRTGLKTIIHKLENSSLNIKFINKSDLDQYIVNGWKEGRGYAKDTGYILVYKYNENFFTSTKISPDELESYIENGYCLGCPRTIEKNNITMVKIIDDIHVKIKINKKYENILNESGWEICKYDLYCGRKITDGFYEPQLKKLKIYIKLKYKNTFIKDNYLLPSKGRCVINSSDIIIQLSEQEISDYIKNGWELGSGIDTHKNVTYVYKIIDGILDSKVINKLEYDYYISKGYKPGNGKSNVSGYIHVYKENIEGIERKMIPKEHLEQYISLGWTKGRKYN